MKKLTIVFITLFMTLGIIAHEHQQQQKFSPEKFQADLEQFITKEACLTPQEAAKFFPIYREMQGKLRVIYDLQRKLGKVKPADEKGCEQAIRQRDEYDWSLSGYNKHIITSFLALFQLQNCMMC